MKRNGCSFAVSVTRWSQPNCRCTRGKVPSCTECSVLHTHDSPHTLCVRGVVIGLVNESETIHRISNRTWAVNCGWTPRNYCRDHRSLPALGVRLGSVQRALSQHNIEPSQSWNVMTYGLSILQYIYSAHTLCELHLVHSAFFSPKQCSNA